MLCLNFKINIDNKNHKILMRGGTVINPNFYEACFYGRNIRDCKKEFIEFLNSFKKDIRYTVYNWYIPPVINLLNSSDNKIFDVIGTKVNFQIEKNSLGEFNLINDNKLNEDE